MEPEPQGDGSWGDGWHEWTSVDGFWQRHTFPAGEWRCWCGWQPPKTTQPGGAELPEQAR